MLNRNKYFLFENKFKKKKLNFQYKKLLDSDKAMSMKVMENDKK